jgi:DNA ligase (NAD+)
MTEHINSTKFSGATSIKAQIDDLTRQIEHHRFAYYVLSRPEISDAEFDRLYRELEALEEKHPDLKSPNSPTGKVGAPPSSEFGSVSHKFPLLSLANAMSKEELAKWHERLKKALTANDLASDNLKYVCELKIDGLSVALTYRNGFLVQGATRGNGEVGEDVTLNLKTIASIPYQLTKPSPNTVLPERLDIRGEVYMPTTSFEELNADLAKAEQPPFANPRNAASGALRQKDPKQTAKRKLAFWAYSAYLESETGTDEPQLKSHDQTLQYLKALGFPVEPNSHLALSLSEIERYCDEWSEKRHHLNYQTDGVVIKADDRLLWDVLGATAHSPRWAVAFKYPPEEAETIVEEVQFEVGRTGAITPAACLRPLQLAGTTVKRATLHNADQIKRLDLRVGDHVIVRKAGEIIPEVVNVLTQKRSGHSEPVRFPDQCPDCGTALEKPDGEVVIRCPNVSGCLTQVRRRIEHWVSRDAMDVDGVGEALIEQLLREQLISNVADLYRLSKDKLIGLERFGEKSADNLLKALDQSKKRPLANLIYALGIRHVGIGGAELLANHFGTLAKLLQASQEEIEAAEGIGPTIASAVRSYFDDHSNQELVKELLEVGIQPGESEPAQAVSEILAGKVFVITGTLVSMDRSEAEKEIRRHGGKSTGTVSKKTSYLICGENPGSKLVRAQELGITIINEAEFHALLIPSN